MNTQQLKTHQKMLAVILGLAVIASIGGSLAYAQEYTAGSGSGSGQGQTPIQGSVNLPQLILSSVKTSFTTAANTAAGQVTNGQVLNGGLKITQDSIVYAFKVTDGTSVYSVIVDAGNGTVLHVSTGHPLTLSALTGGMSSGMGMHGHMGGMYHGSGSQSQTQSGGSGSSSS